MIRALSLLLMSVLCTACTTTPSMDVPLPLQARDHPDAFIVVTVRNDASPASPRAGSTLRGYDGTTRYAVGAHASDTMQAIAASYQLRQASGWPIAELGVHCVVFELPAGADTASLLARLRQDRRVESAQPLNVFATHSTAADDPYQGLQTNVTAMDLKAAHRLSRGAGVNIAVIDTGADISHPDLAGRIVEKQNFVDQDEAAFAGDRHGTAVAGVIAADSDNRIGIVGVAPEARLHIYKSCWQKNAADAGAACNTFTLAKALAAAIDARVQVVNLSLAGPPDSLLTRLVVRGQERGVVFVGALPPSTMSADSVSGFPTGIKGVLKVGTNGSTNLTPDVLHAPGNDVLTLAPQGRYDFVSGNSLATASVTGAVALLLSRNGAMRAEQLERLLARSARVANGSVNACSALSALLNKGGCDSEEKGPQPVAAE